MGSYSQVLEKGSASSVLFYQVHMGNSGLDADAVTSPCTILSQVTSVPFIVKVRMYGWREGSRQTQVSTHKGH